MEFRLFIDERYVGSARTVEEIAQMQMGKNIVKGVWRGNDHHAFTHIGRELFNV